MIPIKEYKYGLRYADCNLCKPDDVTNQMIYKYRDRLNHYLIDLQPTEEEEEIVHSILNDFLAEPDPFPLCENAIENLIAEHVEDYYSGRDIRDRLISALVLTRSPGFKAVFVICRKGHKMIRWYITKDIRELQRTISANLVICNYCGIDSEQAGIDIGIEILNSETLLAVVFKDFKEEGMA